MLLSIYEHNIYSTNTEDYEYLDKLASDSQTLAVLKLIVQIEPQIFKELGKSLFDLITLKSKIDTNVEDCLLLINELTILHFKSYKIDSLLIFLFESQNDVESMMNLLILPKFMNCWNEQIKNTISNISLDLITSITKLLFESKLPPQSKNVLSEILIGTIYNSKILDSLQKDLDLKLDHIYNNLSSILKSGIDDNLAWGLKLHSCLITFSLHYWQSNCDFESLKIIHQRVFSKSTQNDLLIAELIMNHMDRLINHDFNPPLDELNNCITIIDQFKHSIRFEIINKHLKSYCSVSKKKKIEKFIDWYLKRAKRDDKVKVDFFEIIQIRELFLNRFANRLSILTNPNNFENLSILNEKLIISHLFSNISNIEMPEDCNELKTFLEWFMQFPTSYFNMYECQIIQYIMFVLFKSCPSDMKCITVKLFLRFMKPKSDLLLLTTCSSKYLEEFLEYSCNECLSVVELTVKSIIMKRNYQYLIDLVGVFKIHLKNGNLEYIGTFMKEINSKFTFIFDSNELATSIELMQCLKSLCKRISKLIVGNIIVLNSDLYNVLEQLLQWYYQTEPAKIQEFVEKIEFKSCDENIMSLFLIEWNEKLDVDEITNLYLKLLNDSKLMHKAAQLILKKPNNMTIFDAIISENISNFDNSITSLSVFILQDDKRSFKAN
jgi:hypothetical protein